MYDDDTLLQRYLEAQALDYLMMNDDMDTPLVIPCQEYPHDTPLETFYDSHTVEEMGEGPSVS